MKLAFIHLVRTGGTYVREQFAACGVPLLCSWKAGLARDWLRQELYDQMRQECGLIHNHLVNWDRETVQAAKAAGFRTFTIIRDPCERLPSLYAFLLQWHSGLSLDEFMLAQVSGRWAWIDWRHWAVPSWINELDEVLPYSPDMWPVLQARFGLVGSSIGRINASPEKYVPLPSTIEAVKASEFYARYLAAHK